MKKKLLKPTKATVQGWADKAHQHLIDTNPLYAADVARGGTTCWDKPKQKKDEDGTVIDTDWYIHVDEHVDGAFDEDTKALMVDVA